MLGVAVVAGGEVVTLRRVRGGCGVVDVPDRVTIATIVGESGLDEKGDSKGSRERANTDAADAETGGIKCERGWGEGTRGTSSSLSIKLESETVAGAPNAALKKMPGPG